MILRDAGGSVVADGRRSAVGDGRLRRFCETTVLAAADARTALTLSELAGGADDEVQLAAALAVRAVRLGHVFVDLTTVAATTAPDDEEREAEVAALDWPEPPDWRDAVASSPLTAEGEEGELDRPLRLIGDRLYLDRYWRHERSIATDLLRRASAPPTAVDEPVLIAGLDRLFPSAGGDTVDLQRLAAATSVLRHLSVVAGGPGTGKTTTVARILALLHEQATADGLPAPRVALAAPTGKAAARLAEAVHEEATSLDTSDAIRAALLATPASTLHRLLGMQPGSRRIRHDATNQLPHDVVIVDETSMVSLSTMAKLLAAVRDTARLVLVGDPGQLASVEAGAVLGDIVGPSAHGLVLRPPAREDLERATATTVVATDPGPQTSIGDGIVVLRQVHRFAGGIAELAAAIESGDPERVIESLRAASDNVTWIESDTTILPSRAPELEVVRQAVIGSSRAVVDAATAGDPVAALEALRAVQVLCAHRRGPAGASWWRTEIERWLRSAIPGYAMGPWYPGRPILVTENDYVLGVFNGDTGVVVSSDDGRLRAVFDRRSGPLEIRPTRLASVDSLYAITIHKAQGSQFDAVVAVLPEASSPVLTRELLYTAVTRARKQLTVVGTADAIVAAVARPVARASGLLDRLWHP